MVGPHGFACPPPLTPPPPRRGAILVAEGRLSQSLPYPQFIHLLKRRSTFTTNDRTAVAAYEGLRNILATLGAIKRLAFLGFAFVHLFASSSACHSERSEESRSDPFVHKAERDSSLRPE